MTGEFMWRCGGDDERNERKLSVKEVQWVKKSACEKEMSPWSEENIDWNDFVNSDNNS